jgi:lysozyme family protein
MFKNWQFALDKLMISEGGFDTDPSDTGNHLPDGRPGSTMRGVTQAEWEAYVGRQVTWDDMRALTESSVAPLYKRKYWDAVRGDELPSGIDYAIFDFGVNSGIGRAIRIAQQVAGVSQDGVLGPATMAAIQAMNQKDFISKYSAARVDVYKTFHDFDHWGYGWTRRIRQVANDATKLSQVG